MKNYFIDIEEIEDIILAFANGDFTKRLLISDKLNERDIIASGINMLGEELEEKSVSKDYLTKILNSIPQIVVVFDTKGRIDLINEMGINYLINQIEPSKNNIKEFPPTILNEIGLFLKSKKATTSFQVNLSFGKKPSVLYLLCTLSSIKKVKDGHFLFVAKDITNEKNEEKKIIRATILGQENERKRLAYELHDALGQELNAVKMYMTAMEFMDVNSDQFKKSLKEVHKMLNESIESIRDISYNLTPNMLEENGLRLSLMNLVNKLSNLSKVKIETKITTKRLIFKSITEELFIYRVFQEFINNSLKFSGAKNLYLTIKRDNQEKKYIYELADNGVGFDWSLVENKNGITNMLNRLNSLGIDYKFESKPKIGTSLYFETYD